MPVAPATTGRLEPLEAGEDGAGVVDHEVDELVVGGVPSLGNGHGLPPWSGRRRPLPARPPGYRSHSVTSALDRSEHGTLACHSRGCRCPACRRARNRYDRVRRAGRTMLAGRAAVWKVPTTAARHRVAELRAEGMSVRAIAERAGVAEATVRRLLERRRCWNIVSDAICAVP